MATMVPGMNATTAPAFSAKDMDRLEKLAQKHGWSVDETTRRALDITQIVLDAEDDPESKVYVYRAGRRYALELQK